ncbi:MAG: Alpha/beta hydrolase family protein [Planctomycetaceae bacterium]|nr:Alpha/beta hydrolase family protein [Planctomycetaceae bacterium]
MSISVICEHCFGEFRVKDELAGKRVRCKSCSEPIRVPGGEAADSPAPRRRRPILDELDDWEDEPEEELPTIRPKPKSKKKKSRRKAVSINVGPWLEAIKSTEILPIAVPVFLLGMMVLFGMGFHYPAAASWFLLIALVINFVLVVGSTLAFYFIAGKEHFMCVLLCLCVPFYALWYMISRWDRVGGACLFGVVAWAGGWVVITGATQAYRAAGVPVNPAHVVAQVLSGSPMGPRVDRDATELFPLASAARAQFAMGPLQGRQDGIPGTVAEIGPKNQRYSYAGSRMHMRLHLPAGEHPAQSLPCILIAPAGSTLLTGLELGDATYTDETAPYVRAGYAVLEYSIDGASPVSGAQPTMSEYVVFKDAQAGVVNGRNALEFVLTDVPQVDPNRIYAAGHSSAAVLALLLAEHEPRIKACIAYAAASDVETRLTPNLNPMTANREFPGIYTFLKRSSPKTHAAHLNCPVLLFHAQDDNNEPASTTRAFHAQLQALGKPSTLIEVQTGGHYDAMIREGIPAALNWLRQLPGNRQPNVQQPATQPTFVQPPINQPPINQPVAKPPTF